MSAKQGRKSLDDSLFYALAADLNKLTAQYQFPKGSPGSLMHHQYTDLYDKTLEKYGVNKRILREEIARRFKNR